MGVGDQLKEHDNIFNVNMLLQSHHYQLLNDWIIYKYYLKLL